MNQVIEDFVDDSVGQGGADIFDCEFTSIDAVINQVTVFTGVILTGRQRTVHAA
jgi:hypothetical protein